MDDLSMQQRAEEHKAKLTLYQSITVLIQGAFLLMMSYGVIKLACMMYKAVKQ